MNITNPTHTKQTIQGSLFLAQEQQPLQGPGIPPLFGRVLDGRLKRLENVEDDDPSHRSGPQLGPHSRSRPPQDPWIPSPSVRSQDFVLAAQAQQLDKSSRNLPSSTLMRYNQPPRAKL